MKKTTIILIVLAGIFCIMCFSTCSMYNGLVSKSALAEESWANVETNYQRRADLIPNLVSTVKGYASHERETLENITAERANATRPQINFEQLNAKTMAQYQAEQQKVGAAIGRLLAISENYPNLKANQNFMALQDELAGTENRIAVSRRDFNKAIREYNVYVKSFPRNMIAGVFNFEPKASFEAEAGTEKAPQVQF